jgi:hypothetical protein
MTVEALTRTFGLSAEAEATRSDRFAFTCIAALLALYGLSFALFYPNAITITDEILYVGQAEMMVRGDLTVTKVDPRTGVVRISQPGTYPPGTAALMMPLVALFGWRGAFAIPALCLALAVLVTARWLREEGRSPLFALLVLGFVPTLVMARLAMSDVPSAALTAFGLWAFWRGLDRGPGWWIAAGFAAGISPILRAPNPVLFVPLFAGTVLRREKRCWALVLGGVVGSAVYLLVTYWIFGDPLYQRTPYQPDLGTLHERILLYALGLLILVPGGFVLALAYRGRRRPEVIATIIGFVVFFLAQEFSTQWTGPIKRVVLALRYLIPLLPLIAFAMAESVPRLWRQWLERRPAAQRARLERAVAGMMAASLAGLAVACVAMHPLFDAWASTQARIRDDIRSLVPLDGVLITNWQATRKFMPEFSQKFNAIDRDWIDPKDVPKLVERHGRVFIILLDRTDSVEWQQDTNASADFIAALGPAPNLSLLLDDQVSSTDRLRIWRIDRAAAPGAAGGQGPVEGE